MPDRMSVIFVDPESDELSLKLDSEGEMVLLHKEDCQILWDEFKTHTFSRDNDALRVFRELTKLIKAV